MPIWFVPHSKIDGGLWLRWWLCSRSFIPRCYPLSVPPCFHDTIYLFWLMDNIIDSPWSFQLFSLSHRSLLYNFRGPLYYPIILKWIHCCCYIVSLAFWLVIWRWLYDTTVLSFLILFLLYIIHYHLASSVVSISIPTLRDITMSKYTALIPPYWAFVPVSFDLLYPITYLIG